MDDGFAVDLVEIGENALFEFGLGGSADVAEHLPGHFGEETLDEIEPGAVLGREHEGEAPLRLALDPCLGLLGDVGRVVVEDQLDGGLRRVGCIEVIEKSNELARAVAFLDAGMHASGQQVDAGQQAERAVAFVFMVAGKALCRLGSGGISGAVAPIAWMPGFSS